MGSVIHDLLAGFESHTSLDHSEAGEHNDAAAYARLGLLIAAVLGATLYLSGALSPVVKKKRA
jgi:hypothetical protein